MKKILSVALLVGLLASCGSKNEYAAMGRFEAREVIVSSEVSGKILDFSAQEGQVLQASEPVGLIDTLQLSLRVKQLNAQLDALLSSRPKVKVQVAAIQDQLTKAKKEEKRFAALLADGAATQKQLDDIQSQIAVLESELDATLTNLNSKVSSINSNAVALQAQISLLNDQLENCRIASPINGTVLMKYMEAGEFATPGRPLMKVANLDEVYLRAYFTSDQLAKIQLGDSVRVVADFGDDVTLEYPGTIQWIAQESEFTPKTIQTKDTRANLVYAVKVAVKNDGKLKMGLYGQVYL